VKTAYELAMERMGGPLRELSDDQKEQLAEVDRIYDAKVAEAKMSAEQRLRNAQDDRENREQIVSDLSVELASCEERRERDKDKIRQSAANA